MLNKESDTEIKEERERERERAQWLVDKIEIETMGDEDDDSDTTSPSFEVPDELEKNQNGYRNNRSFTYDLHPFLFCGMFFVHIYLDRC